MWIILLKVPNIATNARITNYYLLTLLLRFMLVVMEMLLSVLSVRDLWKVAVELTEAASLMALTSGALPSILRSSSRSLRGRVSEFG